MEANQWTVKKEQNFNPYEFFEEALSVDEKILMFSLYNL